MKTLILIFGTSLIAGLAWLVKSNSEELPTSKSPSNEAEASNLTATDGFTIQPPKSKDGLQIFLINGSAQIEDRAYVTLSNAMENGKVKVHETGSVNELAIDNLSDDYVFIHSGDIVKGGKQDRTVAYDIIVPPRSKDIPLESFCVESSRWQKRGTESAAEFSSNTKMLSSKELKLAAKYEKDQSKVWSRVSDQQRDLNTKVSNKNGRQVRVDNNESASSLQLTLESQELDQAKTDLKEYFSEMLISNQKAIGYAYAINGEIYGVDVYNNRHLLENIWEKLLDAVIVEAVAEYDSTAGTDQVTEVDVKSFINAVAQTQAKIEIKDLNDATTFRIIENEDDHLEFVTEDRVHQRWVHRSFMKYEPADKTSSQSYQRQQRSRH